MNKLFTKILLGVFAVLLFAGSSFAATSVRLQQPQAQTYKDTFDITFVALDTNSEQAISVQCYKKGPSDGSFVVFGAPIALSNGGNTDVCHVDSGVITTDGTYQFQVIASGSEVKTSNTVSVDRNGSTPGTPTNYNKTKPDNCTYKIEFRTANDSGKTIKVVLYRSSETSFSVDSSHQVNSVNIGSDIQGTMTDNVSPNCDTTYYYVIRAFDVYGNGSDVGGDSNVTITNITSTSQTPAQGAIEVGQGGGSVLGTQTGGKKEVLGTESAKPITVEEKETVGQNPVSNATNWVATHKKISLLVLLIVTAIAYYLYRRYKK